MLLKGINTIQGSEIPICMIAVNLQEELIFADGHIVGIIFHHRKVVYLKEAGKPLFRGIASSLYDRFVLNRNAKNVDIMEGIYSLEILTNEDDMVLFTYWDNAMDRMSKGVNEVIFKEKKPDIIIGVNEGYFEYVRRNIYCTVEMREYDVDPLNDEDIKQDDKGDYITRIPSFR